MKKVEELRLKAKLISMIDKSVERAFLANMTKEQVAECMKAVYEDLDSYVPKPPAAPDADAKAAPDAKAAQDAKAATDKKGG